MSKITPDYLPKPVDKGQYKEEEDDTADATAPWSHNNPVNKKSIPVSCGVAVVL